MKRMVTMTIIVYAGCFLIISLNLVQANGGIVKEIYICQRCSGTVLFTCWLQETIVIQYTSESHLCLYAQSILIEEEVTSTIAIPLLTSMYWCTGVLTDMRPSLKVLMMQESIVALNIME